MYNVKKKTSLFGDWLKFLIWNCFQEFNVALTSVPAQTTISKTTLELWWLRTPYKINCLTNVKHRIDSFQHWQIIHIHSKLHSIRIMSRTFIHIYMHAQFMAQKIKNRYETVRIFHIIIITCSCTLLFRHFWTISILFELATISQYGSFVPEINTQLHFFIIFYNFYTHQVSSPTAKTKTKNFSKDSTGIGRTQIYRENWQSYPFRIAFNLVCYCVGGLLVCYFTVIHVFQGNLWCF